MRDDLLLLLLGGLIVQPLGYWVQQGGRRKRQRNELNAELDLRQRIDAHPDAPKLLDHRIAVLLADYLKERSAEPALGWHARTVALTVLLAVTLSVVGATVAAANDWTGWTLTAIGAGIGITANIFAELIERRPSRRAAPGS